MTVRQRAMCAAVCALVACNAHSVSRVAITTPSPHGMKVDRCAALADERTRALTQWSSLIDKVDEAARTKLDTLLQFCAPGVDGAWALGVGEVSPSGDASDPDGVYVRLVLRYRFDDGRDVQALPSIDKRDPANLTLGSAHAPFDFDEPKAFDFDGDGRPEIMLHVSHAGMGEDQGNDWHSVWSLTGGAVAPFPPLAEVVIDGFDDVDGDGRPDPVVVSPYLGTLYYSQGSLGCGSRSVSVPLLWHAVPPGFRTDDAVATAWARRQCSEVIGQPLSDITTGEAGFRWAACQRMSGRTKVELDTAFASRCPPTADEPTCDESLCSSHALFDEAASAKPPLALR